MTEIFASLTRERKEQIHDTVLAILSLTKNNPLNAAKEIMKYREMVQNEEKQFIDFILRMEKNNENYSN